MLNNTIMIFPRKPNLMTLHLFFSYENLKIIFDNHLNAPLLSYLKKYDNKHYVELVALADVVLNDINEKYGVTYWPKYYSDTYNNIACLYLSFQYKNKNIIISPEFEQYIYD